MKLMTAEARLDVPAELASLAAPGRPASGSAAEETLRRMVASLADTLNEQDVCLLQIGAMRMDQSRSYAVAQLLVSRLRDEMAARGAPAALTPEFDAPDGILLATGETTRTGMPHTDSQSVTFLTPSRLDVPTFDPALRAFSSAGGLTSSRHKPYAGIFIDEPGDGLSITTFYRSIELVARAYCYQTGEPVSSVAQLAAWLGANIRAADERRRRNGFRRITLSGLLGGNLDPAWEMVEYSVAEQPLPPELLERFPSLEEVRRACVCGRCSGETERVFCAMVHAALGQGWTDVRQETEIWVSSERYDLILWNNVAMLHSGVKGGGSRRLAAVYLSMAESAGDEYEAWLSRIWHTRLASVLATPAWTAR